MTETTLLLRQIHPSFMQDGYPTSQAFRPTPKDNFGLSVYDGDMITAEQSWIHFTTIWKMSSVGTMGVTVGECTAEGLGAASNPLEDCTSHALIDFTGLTDNQCRVKGKKLQAKAIERKWLHLVRAAG